MHIHLLGICGTFMGSLALLARSMGHKVTGCDQNVYPPMSTQLQEQGIEIIEGYENDTLSPEPDLVIVGNTMSRGVSVIETLLNSQIRYTSGPQWLSEALLQDRWVIAVAGTHGKTTTSSMLAWILTYAKLNPGYLIGGVPKNLPLSSALGEAPFFVIEADEYDSAFFDKRSKFVHYRPRTTILNNLEYDHADIFPDLAAIETQFHHLVRTIPKNGLIVHPEGEPAIHSVLKRGLWTPVKTFAINDGDDDVVTGNCDWFAKLHCEDGSQFDFVHKGDRVGEVSWSLSGRHNVSNAMAAVIAAQHVGVPVEVSAQALCEFESVKRRMETILSLPNGVSIYDDFAHHPTAIATTLQGLRKQMQRSGTGGRVLAVIEPRSNTMRSGVHQDRLADSIADADAAFWFRPESVQWDMSKVLDGTHSRSTIYTDHSEIINGVVEWVEPGDQIVVMSNGGFGGLHQKLVTAIEKKFG